MTAKLSDTEGAVLLALARAAIEEKLFGDDALRRARARVAITPALSAPRAVFVTLEARGEDGTLRLRGCIGTTEARLPAHDAVVESACSAAFADPRFPPLGIEDHRAVVVSVSALTPPAHVPGADAIVVGRDGVILECDDRRAVFLPEVAPRQGWTRLELLEQLARKAGLPTAAWRRARLFTFESEHFGEE
jgi:AmmeMemoRadiSam system protein A